MAQSLLSGDGAVFAFARPQTGEEAGLSAGDVGRGLEEAIRLMHQRPRLELALQRATEAAGSDLTEENYALQQKLRAEKEEFDSRIAALFQRDDEA